MRPHRVLCGYKILEADAAEEVPGGWEVADRLTVLQPQTNLESGMNIPTMIDGSVSNSLKETYIPPDYTV